jgi:hypothetical protein
MEKDLPWPTGGIAFDAPGVCTFGHPGRFAEIGLASSPPGSFPPGPTGPIVLGATPPPPKRERKRDLREK